MHWVLEDLLQPCYTDPISPAQISHSWIPTCLRESAIGPVSVKGVQQPMVLEAAEKVSITCESGQGDMWPTRFGDDQASRQVDDFDLHNLWRLGFWADVACVIVSAEGARSRASTQLWTLLLRDDRAFVNAVS